MNYEVILLLFAMFGVSAVALLCGVWDMIKRMFARVPPSPLDGTITLVERLVYRAEHAKLSPTSMFLEDTEVAPGIFAVVEVELGRKSMIILSEASRYLEARSLVFWLRLRGLVFQLSTMSPKEVRDRMDVVLQQT